MRIRAYDKITDNCKRLSQMHQFRAEPLLLMMSALGGGGLKAHKAWVTLALQKFMQRELRIYDDATKGRTMHYSTKMRRWALPIQVGVSRWAFRTGKDESAPREEDEEEDGDDRIGAGGGAESTTRGASSRRRGEDGDEDEDDEDYESERAEGDAELEVPKPTKPSPNFNTIYGQAMLSNKSYQTSLCECGPPHASLILPDHSSRTSADPSLVYFFRAYESNQYDPLICLHIAQAFFGRSLNRQADNRNYMIAQVRPRPRRRYSYTFFHALVILDPLSYSVPCNRHRTPPLALPTTYFSLTLLLPRAPVNLPSMPADPHARAWRS